MHGQTEDMQLQYHAINYSVNMR